jgi:hypothetical protein
MFDNCCFCCRIFGFGVCIFWVEFPKLVVDIMFLFPRFSLPCWEAECLVYGESLRINNGGDERL